MYYEINVAKDGKHYFATAERSLHTLDSAQALAAEFATLYPVIRGFVITITRYETVGVVQPQCF